MRKNLPSQYRSQAADQAARRLYASKTWQQHSHVLCYISLADELDTRPIIQQAWRQHKRVYVPKINDSRLDFYRIESWADCQIGAFGILEPFGNTQKWDWQEEGPMSAKPLVLVPGAAFDGKGRRLGRGGGFYDQFLSAIRKKSADTGCQPPLCLGMGFERQLCRRVWTLHHDEPVDGMVTEKEIYIYILKLYE